MAFLVSLIQSGWAGSPRAAARLSAGQGAGRSPTRARLHFAGRVAALNCYGRRTIAENTVRLEEIRAPKIAG